MKINPAQTALRKKSDSKKTDVFQSFFKTGPGQYGEGDIFIGVTVPNVRLVAKEYVNCSEKDLNQLLKSPIHEDRLLGLIILTIRYRAANDLKDQKKVVQYFLKNKLSVNNWDLVDCTAASLLGHYCMQIQDDSLLQKLAKSKRHWDKRLAMVGTLAYIRNHQTALTWEFAERFLNEKEDLMHKAAGWMLREAGKKDLKGLKTFIAQHGKKMPRTMLRYSIEKFTPEERAKILKSTKA